MDDLPSYSIEISRQDVLLADLDQARLRQAVELTLRHHQCSRAELHVALVDDATIADLNEKYRGHPGPTDVLSFDLAEPGAKVLDGQIVVSVETARREAVERRHSAEAEVLLYCIHGTLHLLGYDDATPEDARRMHEMEDTLLTELGIGPVYGAKAS
ncbi:MAG TPA: rRNA maturation RNase YbeY [Phycisphaerae bacterium]|nr:rRNA maturation RNase YbeY [Phycisphaerae bacterium]